MVGVGILNRISLFDLNYECFSLSILFLYFDVMLSSVSICLAEWPHWLRILVLGFTCSAFSETQFQVRTWKKHIELTSVQF